MSRSLGAMAMALAILVPARGGVPLQKQKKRPENRAAAADRYIFAAPPMKSEGFRGEVASDHDLFYEQDVFPDREGRRQMAWSLMAETQPEAEQHFKQQVMTPLLGALGFLPVNDEDLVRLKAYRGMGELDAFAPGATIYRAKDAEALQKATGMIALLGSRERGRLSAMPLQVLLEVRLGSFRYDHDQAHFMVKVVAHLYGIRTYETGDGGRVTFFDPTEVSTAVLTDTVCGALRRRRAEGNEPRNNVGQDSRTPNASVPPQAEEGASSQDLAVRMQQLQKSLREILLRDASLRFADTSARDIKEVRPLLVPAQLDSARPRLVVDTRGREGEIPYISSYSNLFLFRANQSICDGREAPILVFLGSTSGVNEIQMGSDQRPMDAGTYGISEPAPSMDNGKGFYFRKKNGPGFYLILFPASGGHGARIAHDSELPLYLFRSR